MKSYMQKQIKITLKNNNLANRDTFYDYIAMHSDNFVIGIYVRHIKNVNSTFVLFLLCGLCFNTNLWNGIVFNQLTNKMKNAVKK